MNNIMGELSNGRPDVSVVIPSYNSLDTIEDCLRSILAQNTSRTFEVIVVDSSSDDTHELIQKFPTVKLVKMAQKTLSGAARNIGVLEAGGDIICFIDSDCTTDPDWIENLCSLLVSSGCSAVGGAVDNACDDCAVSWASYITEFSEFTPSGPSRERERCVTCNLAVDKSALIELGGFDEKLELYTDAEFCQQLTSNGKRLLFDPSIRVRHRLRTTLGSYANHEIKRGRGAVALRRAGLLPGKSIVKFPPLGVAAAPIMLFRHMFADFRRLSKQRFVPPGKIASALPYFIIGSCCWAVGFAAESIVPTVDTTTTIARRHLAARNGM